MLREFVQEQQCSRPVDFNENADSTISAFYSYIDFLRNPERFPNKDINSVTTLMWRLIENNEIPLVLDQWGIMPSLRFAVFGKAIEQRPILIIPTSFLQQTENNPVSQLGDVAYMASQCRDFYCGEIKGDNSREINARAQAFEAEALLELQEMASQEGVNLVFNIQQLECLARFPKGLRSLPQGMNYATPIYFRPTYNIKN